MMACRTHNGIRGACAVPYSITATGGQHKETRPGSCAWPSAHGMEGRAGRTRQNPAAALHRRTAKLLVRERADASPRSLGTGLLLLRPANEAHAPYSLRPQQYMQLPSVTRAYSAERACPACELAACLTSRCYR